MEGLARDWIKYACQLEWSRLREDIIQFTLRCQQRFCRGDEIWTSINSVNTIRKERDMVTKVEGGNDETKRQKRQNRTIYWRTGVNQRGRSRDSNQRKGKRKTQKWGGKWKQIQFSSVAQSCPTLCDPMDCSTPGLPVHHQLLESTQTHVHWVGDAIQPSHPLSSPSPPAFNLSQHQGLFKWVSFSQWTKYWSFSFNISPSNEHPELISFRMDWLDLLEVQGTFSDYL